jgi:hypothetical protein
MVNLATLATVAKAGVVSYEAILRINTVLGSRTYLTNTLRITGRANHLQRDRIAFFNRSSCFAGNAISHSPANAGKQHTPAAMAAIMIVLRIGIDPLRLWTPEESQIFAGFSVRQVT